MTYYILFELLIILTFTIGGSIIWQKDKEITTDFLSFNYTTILRGVAILMVYLQHTMGALGTRAFTPLGGGGVAIFLILSGFGLSESYKKKGIKHFWKRKIVGILIPWICIYMLFLADWSHVSLSEVIGNTTLLQTKCWYLQYLFLWYIIFYISHKFTAITPYKYWIMSSIAIAIFFLGTDLQAEQALTFPIGVWLSDNKRIITTLSDRKQTIFAIASGCLAIMFLTTKQIPVIRENFDNALLFHSLQIGLKTSIAWMVIMGLQKFKSLQKNITLKFTGIISFELYLIHIFTVPPFMNQLDIENKYIYILIFLLSSYIFSYIFHMLDSKVLEKLK